jgi:hypothetical protein
MDANEITMVVAVQQYTKQMQQYFNPFQVVGNTIAGLPINPYLIKCLTVEFLSEDRDTFYNVVRVRVEFDMPFPEHWGEQLRCTIERTLKEAFTNSYGKKADKYWDEFQKGPSYFTKEFTDEIRPS